MFTTLDLCSGVGGCSQAFHNAGFKTSFACDIEPKCKITYDLNFTKPKLTTADLFELSPSQFHPFDVLVAGFPCQSFSIAGKRLGFQDGTRGNVFFQLAEILNIQRPKAFLFENVKNLKTHDNGQTLKTIEETIESLNYSLDYQVLNTKDYGLPQNRERIFFVGFNKDVYGDKPFNWAEPVPLTLTIQDLLDSPDTYPELHITPEHKHFQKIVEGVSREDTIYQFRRSYIRENKSKVCPTITAAMGGVLTLVKQGDVIRMLSPRELFRFQGFPESYVLPDLSYADLHHQAGNSVTVYVVESIARKMMEFMTENTAL